MPAQRYAAARRRYVGFGSDGVLMITQRVGGVGDDFREHDAGVGFTRTLPAWKQLPQAIEQHGPERAVVFREVVDRRRRGQIGETLRNGRRAIEIRSALDLERKRNLGELRIEFRQHFGDFERVGRGLRCVVDQPQRVRREIAGDARADDERIRGIGERREVGVFRRRCVRRRLGSRRDPHGNDVRDALASLDEHVAGRENRGHRLQAMHEQRLLPRTAGRRRGIQHLEIIDAVDVGISENRRLAVLVATRVDHVVPP